MPWKPGSPPLVSGMGPAEDNGWGTGAGAGWAGGRDRLLGEAGTLDEDEDCSLGGVHVGRGVGVPEPGSRVA